MTRPDTARLLTALDATWPAAEVHERGPWKIRKGNGGGQRVSAATLEGPFDPDDMSAAEDAMRGLAQSPLFMVRDGEDVLDRALQDRGYEVVDPVVIYLGATPSITADLPITSAFPSWPPLAAQLEIWAAAGIGPARVDIMQRCPAPKTSVLARTGDVPAGTAFVGIDGDIGMIHAIEVDPSMRRSGVGRSLIQGCANWSAQHGAGWLCLAVTRDNIPANQLYKSLGMVEAARYHYRRAPKDNG